MSETTPPAGSEKAPPGTSAPGAEGTAASVPEDATHHWWRLIAVWVVLSAVLDPLFYYLAGPHIPPGTMTDVAQGAQFDFNVLFVIALACPPGGLDLLRVRHLDVARLAGWPGARRWVRTHAGISGSR